MSVTNNRKGFFALAIARMRVWIRNNITGEAGADFRGQPSDHPPSTEENLQSMMEETELMPPSPFTTAGDVNHKAVEFWVNKLIDIIFGGIGAGFVWLLSRIAGRNLSLESEHQAFAENILPGLVWVACFLVLSAKRFLDGKRNK